MTRRTFLTGLAILLLAPTLVLAAFAAYVYWVNAAPQPGMLECGVSPRVVFPWQEAQYYITLRGEALDKDKAALPALDIVFLIDVSGSMWPSLAAMADAARRASRELAQGRGKQVRFALIRFDTEAEINTPWTNDLGQLDAGLRNLKHFTGENDAHKAFLKLEELLKTARPEAKKLAVFCTDGLLAICPPRICPDGPMSEAQMIEAAKNLRGRGLEIYSIGIPTSGSAPLMQHITGSPSHVFNPADLGDLSSKFREVVVDRTIPEYGTGAIIFHRLDGRHFTVPLEKTSWIPDKSGGVLLEVGRLSTLKAEYAHPLTPHSAGLWKVGLEPPLLVYTTPDGKKEEVKAARRPRLLVITWFVLFLAGLPALWWVFQHAFHLEEAKRESTGLVLPEIIRRRPPMSLPALPPQQTWTAAPIPTLFIGLGGLGHQALWAVRAELKEAHLATAGLPYRFLCLDLEARDSHPRYPFADWPEYPVTCCSAPREIYQAHLYLPSSTPPPHLKWFDPHIYLDKSAEELNLREGSRGDRALARLALFQWLGQKDSSLLAALTEACRALESYPSPDCARQVVVFASRDGGVGSGWFQDLGRLLHRFFQEERRAKGGIAEVREILPEIIGLLADQNATPRPGNRSALEQEMESATLTGAYHRWTTYVPEDNLLDRVDTESPYHWRFLASGQELQGAAAQLGELGAVLVERHPRATLLEQAMLISRYHPVAAGVNAIHVMPSLLHDWVHRELFRRLLGPEILLDLEPTPQGKLALRTYSWEEARAQLEKWARDEPPGTPWQAVLAAAVDPQAAVHLISLKQQRQATSKEWLKNAFAASLSQRLQGGRRSGEAGWCRFMMPGEAVASLRELAVRLDESVLPHVSTVGASPEIVELLGRVREQAEMTATELARRLEEYGAVCLTFLRRWPDPPVFPAALQALPRRLYLEEFLQTPQIEHLARTALERWLQVSDTASSIRERLFFTVTPEGDRIRVTLKAHMAERQEFTQAETAIRFIDDHCRALARTLSALRLAGALETLSPAQKQMLQPVLLADDGQPPSRVVVVAPSSLSPPTREDKVLEAFRATLPQPPTQGIHSFGEGWDQAALRRVLLSSTQPVTGHEVHLVELAEKEAEKLRQRLERHYHLRVPLFPPELRIALARPQAFRSFARAYETGQINRGLDAAGQEQWLWLERGDFLTYGENRSLAAAAANYVWFMPEHPADFLPRTPPGDFTALETWSRQGGEPSVEVVVLAALNMVLSLV